MKKRHSISCFCKQFQMYYRVTKVKYFKQICEVIKANAAGHPALRFDGRSHGWTSAVDGTFTRG